MQKEYHCSDCGKNCSQPTYVRLHLTASGYRSASKLPRWQRSIPLGHFCEECLLLRVRSATGNDNGLCLPERHSTHADAFLALRTQREAL
jgi:hypothetical protein